jgi:hypothetical protein
VLILAAEHVGKTTLSVGANLLCLLVALAISITTYLVFENPIRTMRIPSRVTVALGVGLIAVTVGVMTLAIHHDTSLAYPKFTIVPGDAAQVTGQVAASRHITVVPHVLDPPLAKASGDRGNFGYVGCSPGADASTEPLNEPSCVLGDPTSSRRIVVYGDSHALMWLPAFNSIAKAAHMKLTILGKVGCPMADLSYKVPQGLGLPTGSPFTACDQWNRWARAWIAKTKPALVVVTQQPPILEFTPKQWYGGMNRALSKLEVPGVRTVVLGNIPILPVAAPQCLPIHESAVQACSGSTTTWWTGYNFVEKAAAASHGMQYLNPTPWFCSRSVCPAIIGHYEVYSDADHITAAYAQYLSKVLGQTLGVTPVATSAPASSTSPTTAPSTTSTG